MPARPPSICRQPGCGVAIAKPGYCAAHARPAGGWQQDSARGTRQERGYGAEWEQIRSRILARACGLCECEACRRLGRVRRATEVDHVLPKAQGGTDDDANLQAINRDCHKAKTLRERGAKTPPALPASGAWVRGTWVIPRRRA